MNESLLTPQQLADRLNVPLSWVYERSRYNALPGMIRLGRYVRFSERAIEQFLAQEAVKSVQPSIE
jgi:excisionase family DNA binding protein